MKVFGFLCFGHYAFGGQSGPSAEKIAKTHLEIAQAANEIGINNASFRAHHFVPQASAPMPLLGAVAATTKHIEVGTGVIDMRYENPLYLAEEAASLYQVSGDRVPLGVSRGTPEVAVRGWEAFGYKDEAPNGADVARTHLEAFMAAVDGNRFATAAPLNRQYPNMFQPASALPVFPIADGADMQMFGMQATGSDQMGMLPDVDASAFGRTFAAEPDKLIEQLEADPTVMSAAALLITISTGMGTDVNVKILDDFATHVAPALGWQPNREGPVTGYPIE